MAAASAASLPVGHAHAFVQSAAAATPRGVMFDSDVYQQRIDFVTVSSKEIVSILGEYNILGTGDLVDGEKKAKPIGCMSWPPRLWGRQVSSKVTATECMQQPMQSLISRKCVSTEATFRGHDFR
mmetsp:Transcript_15250/g.33170  ORF Transcript_15250/g.33170 Transcript_15250/m.33170 type:complete len:125 (-) Transcript_15250:13-387(-)|eukprot:CAMPEP_0178476262 /NCGR_PEP_ID=MMETSP0696-20121128/3536_1 /TAXON_ID=265572 /ORGANISM="Extubocellulus spinifer, Strain CCMP396" /LENGTH=124 /DNA_ID=CAMNT_0020103559 /DNA_START=85 /DNA_END=459 /DNA_ORIENTATION=+